jgi:hypothetical protein
MEQLGSSLGIAVLGTVFFANIDGGFVNATKIVTLVALGLTAVTFALGFLLPHKAKAAH